jgi:protein-tyrosine phosphatase
MRGKFMPIRKSPEKVNLRKILFVCTGNAHRSPLAEALLKKFRPDLKVESAGLRTPIPISDEARVYLAKQNAEQYLKKAPQSLDVKRLEDYGLIIAMEPRHKIAVTMKCPQCEHRTVVWNIEDPYSMSPEDAEKIYAEIKEKVKELARTL